MNLSENTITAIARLVTGDAGLSKYRTGPKLVQLFNSFGSNDVYGQGFPSRWDYTEQRLRTLNDSPAIGRLLREVLHPREFVSLDARPAYEYLNERLKFDGYEVVWPVGGIGQPVIQTVEGSMVQLEHRHITASQTASNEFLQEQIAKCDEKLREGDYDGAITNARSFIEAVLLELDKEFVGHADDYDGDLPKLYKRVQKAMKLEPERPDLDTPLKQVLSGLASIVSGISGLSNKMGDRHARRYKPAKRHAVLVVDSAKTLASFLVASRVPHRSARLAGDSKSDDQT